MSADQALARFFKEITDEVKRNPSLKRKLVTALIPLLEHEDANEDAIDGASVAPKRMNNRRSPAALDPIQIYRQGEDILRQQLSSLDLDRLRDIVAQFGMDTGKLVMKWKDPHRVIDRIKDVSKTRAQKGSAFKEHSADGSEPAEGPSTPPRTP